MKSFVLNTNSLLPGDIAVLEKIKIDCCVEQVIKV